MEPPYEVQPDDTPSGWLTRRDVRHRQHRPLPARSVLTAADGRGTVSAGTTAPGTGTGTSPGPAPHAASSRSVRATLVRRRSGTGLIRGTGLMRAAGLAAGLGAGLAAALPLVALACSLAASGWAPTGDEAVIAWRSWDVLAGPSPLLGQFTQASAASSVPVFDPGPMLYWVLAGPSHILPAAGAMVGSLTWSALCVVVACVAAGRAGGVRPALGVAAGFLLLEWSLSAVAGEAPAWNPYAGLLPFAALLVLTVVIATGRLGWLPAAVVLASFLAQAHLMYAAAAVGCLVLGAVAGLVGPRWSPRDADRRWGMPSVALTVLVVAACWWPAAYQQATGRPGNVTELLRAVLGASRPTVGWRVALGSLGETLGPLPAWARPPAGFTVPHARPATAGWVAAVVVLVTVAAVGVLAARHRRRGLAAAAGIAVISALGACWALAGLSVQTANSYAYIRYVQWPVALLLEAVLAWALASAVHNRRAAAPRRAAQAATSGLAVPTAVTALTALTAAAAVLLAVGAAVNGPHRAALAARQPRGAAITFARSVGDLIGRPPRRDTRVSVDVAEPGGLTTVALMTATGYRLRTMGWTPALPPPWSQVFDRRYAARPSDPVLGVGPLPAGARLLGRVDVPLQGTGVGVTPLRTAPVWILPGRS